MLMYLNTLLHCLHSLSSLGRRDICWLSMQWQEDWLLASVVNNRLVTIWLLLVVSAKLFPDRSTQAVVLPTYTTGSHYVRLLCVWLAAFHKSHSQLMSTMKFGGGLQSLHEAGDVTICWLEHSQNENEWRASRQNCSCCRKKSHSYKGTLDCLYSRAHDIKRRRM